VQPQREALFSYDGADLVRNLRAVRAGQRVVQDYGEHRGRRRQMLDHGRDGWARARGGIIRCR
jgi:hypothetical protein